MKSRKVQFFLVFYTLFDIMQHIKEIAFDIPYKYYSVFFLTGITSAIIFDWWMKKRSETV